MVHESWNSGASSSLSVTTPSFSTRSSEDIADIAARVLHELNLSNHDDDFYDDDYYSSLPQNDAVKPHTDETNKTTNNDDDDDVESEFEFAVLCNEDESSPISADEIFANGQIKTTYPIFGYKYDVVSTKTTSLRLPLRKLMKQDNDNENGNDDSSSSSSSSDDELEGVPKETYCAWAPPGTLKKKSNSTGTVGSSSGSSRRWSFKDLLHRSHSDGKDSFDFTTTSRKEKVTGDVIVNGKNKKGGVKKTKKKKSYLPYRQDIVGLFGNVNGLSQTIRPF